MGSHMVVTIVCLCYNQAPFLRESVESALRQNHPHLDIWVLDDHSSDGSQEIIRSLKAEYPSLHIRLESARSGHNRLFNRYLPEYRGEAIIDLAADDVLLPERVAAGVRAFSEHPACGVNFTNAELINEGGNHLSWHFPVNDQGQARIDVPEGDLFTELVSRYLVNPVSMMIRQEVLDQLGGFDEDLSYEDFDFWVRSARNFPYCYTDRVLVRKRVHQTNYSHSQYVYGSIQMRDTYQVCRKIRGMIRTRTEQRALQRRVRYEMRQCVRHGNLKLFYDYLKLL